MGSLAGKNPANTYKSLVKVADESNGISSSASVIESGNGVQSCTSIGTRSLSIQPNANTTNTFDVKHTNGDALLTVDTNNSEVKVGTSQVNATTQLLTFSGFRILPSLAGRHMFVPLGVTDLGGTASTEISMGDGTNPDTSGDKGTSTVHLVYYMWNVPYNMVIDAVKVFASTDQDTDVVLNYHLMSYDISSSGDTNDGNLSNGTVLADGQATAVDRSVLKQTNLTIQSSSVTSGKVIACCVENETNTDDINIQVQVKYHIA